MNWKKRMISALLAALLCLTTLSGCGLLEEYQRKQEQKRRVSEMASEAALDYVSDTYGGKAKVLDTKLGTTEAGFTAYLTGKALVTVSLDGEEFQVYVDLGVPLFCTDNRSGLALADALDEYFRGLYGLPPALEYSVRVYSADKDFFASWSTNPANGYNFLDFDYYGQPLEEVFPLLGEICFYYDYVDDSVALDHIEFREEDWGGSVERLRVRLRCFRCYNEDSMIPLGIQVVDGQPVLMAEGMVFSYNSAHFYATLDDIASAVSYLSLRENLRFHDGETIHQHYMVTRMGNFWVTTQKGFTAEECYELRPCEPGWVDSIDLLAGKNGVYYTKEDLEGDLEMAASTRKELRPFVDAQFQTVGEMLCLREGVAERIQAWREQFDSYSYQYNTPVYVTVRPSLIYQSDAQMGLGRTKAEDDGLHHAVKLCLSYLKEEKRWMHGLSNLMYSSYPDEIVLLSVVKPESEPSIWERFARFIKFR